MAEGILDKIMNTLKGIETDESTLTVGEGGQSIDLFTSDSSAWEPNIWEIDSESFTTTANGGRGAIDIFLNKGRQLALDAPEDFEGLQKVDIGTLSASGEVSDQEIDTFIETFDTNTWGETWLEGRTKDGEKYRFILENYTDKATGEEVYMINGDKFDKNNYNATIENINEKLDNVSFAVSEKFEKDGTLGAQEYISAAKQKPKITVGKPYQSSGYNGGRKPWWR